MAEVRSLIRRACWSSLLCSGLLSALILTTSVFSAEKAVDKATLSDWPHWRGPAWDGVSREPNIPTDWSREKNVVWRIPDPGFGHSSPIIWGKNLFYTTTKGESRLLVRVDADTGAEIWRREVLSSPLEQKHRKNSHASATPAVPVAHPTSLSWGWCGIA